MLEGLECFLCLYFVLFCFVYFAKGLAKAKCGGFVGYPTQALLICKLYILCIL